MANLGHNLARPTRSSSSSASSPLLSSILGALYHSDWDFAPTGSPITPGTGIASAGNLGSCTSPLVQVTGASQPQAVPWDELTAARLDGFNDSLMAVFSGADIIAANARPYCWLVLRGRPAGSSRFICSVQTVSADYPNFGLQLSTSDVSAAPYNDRIRSERWQGPGALHQDFLNYAQPCGTTKHLVEFSCAAPGENSLVLDGIAGTTMGGGPEYDYVSTVPLTHAVLGGIFYQGAPYMPASVDVGQYMIAPSQPSAEQLLAVRAVLKAKWMTL